MPVRYLKPGLRTSAKWNAASFSAQSLYISILTLVDDFGRYDARPMVIHGECRILRANDSNPQTFADNCQQTLSDLRELDVLKLIKLYTVDGKEYLQVTNWQERVRQKQSRFPDPPTANASTPPANDSSPPANDRQLSDNCTPPTPYALRLTPTPSPDAKCDNSIAEPVQHAEAQLGLSEISWKCFGEKITTWGMTPGHDYLLQKALPFRRDRWEALRWLYDQPHDDPMFHDRKNPAYTQRKQKFMNLLQDLEGEAQKALTLQRQLAAAQKNKKQEEEPAGWLK